MLDNLFKKKLKNILIVDDSRPVLKRITRIVQEFLNKNGLIEGEDYQIDTFKSVTEFTDNRKVKYDLAFVDWNIGGTDKELGSAVIDALEKDNCQNMSIYSGQDEMSPDILRYRVTKKRVDFIFKDFKTHNDVPRIKKLISTAFKINGY